MAVDLERAWYRLKARLPEKRSWGTGQLAELMAEIEVDCQSSDEEASLPLSGGMAAPASPGEQDEEETTDRPSTAAAA